MISVVIPVFNRPQGVLRAIRSVLDQQGCPHDIEVVVVDDASVPPLTFGPPDGRVRIVRLERNSGAAAARNTGIRAAKGEIIAFLDSDDIWLPGKLAQQIALLQSLADEAPRPGRGLNAVVCGFYCPSRLTERLQSRMPKAADRVADFVRGCWFCPGSALVIRRSAFDVVGWLDERLRRLEDLDWFVRFGQAGGRLHVTPALGCVIAPSYSGATDTIDRSARLIEDKFGPSGPNALKPDEWRDLQAYLALERGAALLHGGMNLKGAGRMLASLWHRPRFRAAVGEFWEQSDTVPAAVTQTYAEMLRAPR